MRQAGGGRQDQSGTGMRSGWEPKWTLFFDDDFGGPAGRQNNRHEDNRPDAV